MTLSGRRNLLWMISLPVVATLTSAVCFGLRPDTMGTVFAMNAAPMLLGGAISGLLLLGSPHGPASRVAIWPTAVPAIIGIFWYVGRAIFPATVAPGVEYIAAPQYLLVLVLLMGLLAAVARFWSGLSSSP